MTDQEVADSFSQLQLRSNPIDYTTAANRFTRDCINLLESNKNHIQDYPLALASIFDLAVTAVYMERVATANWYYCNLHDRSYCVYPFVNACPVCTIEGSPTFVRARKPKSATIGAATSAILAAFLEMEAQRNLGPEAAVFTVNDNGVVDAFLKYKNKLVLFEIKSAPLIAFPIISETEKLTSFNELNEDISEPEPHSSVSVSREQQCFLLVDEFVRIPTGSAFEFQNNVHYQKILDWLNMDENLFRYTQAWHSIFTGYADQTARKNSHWLTNGCGVPRPRPKGWPRRRSSGGFESISDGKSSVGMDRTDDLKKGIYQVLKISTHYKEFFPNSNFEVYSAIASNIHAVKHDEDYLSELRDIVWTVDSKDRNYIETTDSGDHIVTQGKLYNLFDATITLTSSHFRTPFLSEAFNYGT